MTVVVDGIGAGRPNTRAVSAQVEAEFPGVAAWYGYATGKWWALVCGPGGWRLVEATHPLALREAIANAGGLPWPR